MDERAAGTVDGATLTARPREGRTVVFRPRRTRAEEKGMIGERGLYKFGGLLFIAILVISAVAYLTGGDETAEAAPSARAAPAPGRGDLALARPVPADAACAPDGTPVPLQAEIRESSGVAVSRTHAGIVWTHNDSGEPLLYAVDAAGRTVGRVRLAGAAVEDWEDVARAPCPAGGDCLYVADIGDNDGDRPSVTVYRVPEPAPDARQSAPATAIRLRYPDGAHDAEAMFVLHGAIHVVTKGENGSVAVYRARADASGEAAMERIRTLAAGRVRRPERVTGGDASADGRWVALRTLREVVIYPAAELAGSGPLTPRRVDLRALDEAQGEGLGFAPDGSMVLTSEAGKGGPATLARLACTLP